MIVILAVQGYLGPLDSFSEDVSWLSKNVYFEARGEPLEGKLAVMEVTINRVNDSNFPDSIEDVVTQANTGMSWRTGTSVPLRHQCSFSWYCDGELDWINPLDIEEYIKITFLSIKYLTCDCFEDVTDGATHYHANYVNPYWSNDKDHTVTINNHLFYK